MKGFANETPLVRHACGPVFGLYLHLSEALIVLYKQVVCQICTYIQICVTDATYKVYLGYTCPTCLCSVCSVVFPQFLKVIASFV